LVTDNGEFNKTAREAPFVEQRGTAYRELWDKLEDAHIRIRTESIGQRDFDDIVLQTNALLIKQSLYVTDGDQALAREYVQALYRLRAVVLKSHDRGARRAMATTAAFTDDEFTAIQEVGTVSDEVTRLRNELISRVRSVLGSTTL
jgi:hypothetical protein